MRFRPRAFALQLAHFILSITLFNSLWLQGLCQLGIPPFYLLISAEEGVYSYFLGGEQRAPTARVPPLLRHFRAKKHSSGLIS